MKRDEIIAKWERLTPRERDAWVAEVIFGSTVHHEYSPDGPIYLDATTLLSGRRHIRNYTTDISAAWAILTEVSGEFFLYRSENGGFVASFGYSAEECSECGDEPFEVEAQGKSDNVPEAMCLAALISKLTEGAD